MILMTILELTFRMFRRMIVFTFFFIWLLIFLTIRMISILIGIFRFRIEFIFKLLGLRIMTVLIFSIITNIVLEEVVKIIIVICL